MGSKDRAEADVKVSEVDEQGDDNVLEARQVVSAVLERRLGGRDQSGATTPER